MLALRRLAAYAIDWSLFAIWATGIVGVVLLSQGGSAEWTDAPWKSQALGALFTTLPFGLYLSWCEAAPRGRTIGKRVLRIRVTTAEGDAGPRFSRAAIRTIVKLLPWELGHTAAHQLMAAGIAEREAPAWAMGLSFAAMALNAGYVLMLFVGDGRAPHDRASRTRVVAA